MREKCESVDLNQEEYRWNGRSNSCSLPRLIIDSNAVGQQQQCKPVMGWMSGTCTRVLWTSTY